jgi:hypothetical protein
MADPWVEQLIAPTNVCPFDAPLVANDRPRGSSHMLSSATEIPVWHSTRPL